MTKENYDFVERRITMSDNWTKLHAVYNAVVEEKLALTNEEYWELVIAAWTSSEHNSSGIHLKMWVEVFQAAVEPAPEKHRKDIPQGRFKIYRGGEAHGLSWSKWKKKAVFFQKRKLKENAVHNPIPQTSLGPLSEKTIGPEDVLFYTDAREEKEVVILPTEAIEYMKTGSFVLECKAFDEVLEKVQQMERQTANFQLFMMGQPDQREMLISEHDERMIAYPDGYLKTHMKGLYEAVVAGEDGQEYLDKAGVPRIKFGNPDDLFNKK